MRRDIHGHTLGNILASTSEIMHGFCFLTKNTHIISLSQILFLNGP
jgi:hypothetical protein